MGWLRRFINNLISEYKANKVLKRPYASFDIHEEIELRIALSAGRLSRRYLWSTLRNSDYADDIIGEALFRLESEKKIRLVDPEGQFSGFEKGYYEFV